MKIYEIMNYWPKGHYRTYYYNETIEPPEHSSDLIRFAPRTYPPFVFVTYNYVIGEEEERDSSFNVAGPIHSVIVESAKKGNLR